MEKKPGARNQLLARACGAVMVTSLVTALAALYLSLSSETGSGVVRSFLLAMTPPCSCQSIAPPVASCTGNSLAPASASPSNDSAPQVQDTAATAPPLPEAELEHRTEVQGAALRAPSLSEADLKGLLSKHARSNTVVIVPADLTAVTYLRTMLCSIVRFERRAGKVGGQGIAGSSFISNILIQALMPDVMPILTQLQLDLEEHTGVGLSFGIIPFDPLWGSSGKNLAKDVKEFRKQMRRRPFFWAKILEAGFDFVNCDADFIFFSNPLDSLLNSTMAGDADIQASTDNRLPFEDECDPYEYQSTTPRVCPGFWLVRSNHRTRRLVSVLMKTSEQTKQRGDQAMINVVLNKKELDIKLVGEIPYGLPLKPSNSFPQDVARFTEKTSTLPFSNRSCIVAYQEPTSKSVFQDFGRLPPEKNSRSFRTGPPSLSKQILLPPVPRQLYPDTLSIKILDQEQFMNGAVYHTLLRCTRRLLGAHLNCSTLVRHPFDKIKRSKSTVAIHGNFGFKHEWKLFMYKRNHWDGFVDAHGRCK